MNDFRQFLQAVILIFLPRAKKKFRLRGKVVEKPLAIKPDEYILENNKPFRFSREGARWPIEKRQR